MSRRLQEAALVVGFLGAIVIANLTLTNFGVNWLYINAFFLIGFDFISRDRLADFWAWGPQRWVKMTLLIAAGGAISYALNADAKTIAIASTVSFMAAEFGETIFYQLWRNQPWLERAPKAAIIAAAIDSIIFPSWVFGFSFVTSFTQWAVKLGGAAFWALIIIRLMPGRSRVVEVIEIA